MKRLVLVLTFFVMTGIVKGQDAIVVSGGEKKAVSIKGYSLEKLRTSSGDIGLSEIDSVIFSTRARQYNTLYKTLDEVGVSYLFTQSVIKVEATSLPVDLAIDKFRKERTVGKILQLAGTVVVALSLTSDDPQPIAIVGGVLSGIGFAVDIGAGRHLKKQ